MTGSPTRILQVIEALGGGGAERHVLDLSGALQARGVDTVVVARWGRLAEGRVDVRLVPDGSRMSGWVRALDDACAQRPVDVIHVHSFMPLPAARIVGWRRGVPVVFTVHGWKPAQLLWRARVLKALRARRVLAVSEEIGRELDDCGVANLVVRNAVIDRNDGAPVLHGGAAEPAPPRLVAVGRLEEQKNHAALLAAVARLRDDGFRVRLDVLGDGSLRDALGAQIQRLDLGDLASLRGHVDPGPYYRDAVCAVSASRWEGLSLAYVEALMWGLPLVITPTSGSDAVVATGHNGVIVADDAPETLAAGIREVLDDDPAAMGGRSRQRYEAEFTHEAMVDKIVSTYVDVTDLVRV